MAKPEHIQLRAFLLAQCRPETTPEANWVEAQETEVRLDKEALSETTKHETSLGVYGRDSFYIRLSSRVSLLNDDGTVDQDPSTETLAVFAHEYAHFLQNTTTVSGWDSYDRNTTLIRCFSNALTDDGFCDPTLLSGDDQDTVRDLLLQERRAHGGKEKPVPPRTAHRKIEVSQITPHVGGWEDCCRVRWTVTDSGGNVETGETAIGSILVEEGLAYLLECSVRTGRPCFHEEAAPALQPAPLYPYVAFQALCRHIVPEITPAGAMRVAVLALNSHRPGCFLVKLLEAYQRSASSDDASTWRAIANLAAAPMGQVLSRLRTETSGLANLFNGRGDLEFGGSHISNWFADGLDRRGRQIDYDIAWATGAVFDKKALLELIATTKPCDVFQGRPCDSAGQPQQDVWLSASQDLKARAGVRGIQALIHFMRAHLYSDGFVATGHIGAPRCCPYYRLCDDSKRTSDPATCARHPWAHWRANPKCLYGLGVTASMNEFRSV